MVLRDSEEGRGGAGWNETGLSRDTRLVSTNDSARDNTERSCFVSRYFFPHLPQRLAGIFFSVLQTFHLDLTYFPIWRSGWSTRGCRTRAREPACARSTFGWRGEENDIPVNIITPSTPNADFALRCVVHSGEDRLIPIKIITLSESCDPAHLIFRRSYRTNPIYINSGTLGISFCFYPARINDLARPFNSQF